MRDLLKDVLDQITLDCKDLKEVGNFDEKKVKPFFDVVRFVNSTKDVYLLGGIPLSEFMVEERFTCLILPKSIKAVNLDAANDLLVRFSAPEPQVTPEEFKKAQEYILGRYKKKNGNYTKSLKECRVEMTLCEDVYKNMYTKVGLNVEAQTLRVYPIQGIEGFFDSDFYKYSTEYDDLDKSATRVSKAIALRIRDLITK